MDTYLVTYRDSVGFQYDLKIIAETAAEAKTRLRSMYGEVTILKTRRIPTVNACPRW